MLTLVLCGAGFKAQWVFKARQTQGSGAQSGVVAVRQAGWGCAAIVEVF